MSYVIHGATGAQGSPVVSALAAAGKPVTALTRNADAAVEGARVADVGLWCPRRNGPKGPERDTT